MTQWQRIWRLGIAPLLSAEALAALAAALRENDARLVQGSTTEPIPVPINAECPVEGGCAIAFGLWRGHGLKRVGPLHLAFRRLCRSADDLLDEPLATAAFIHWFDETPRDEVRRLLLAELEDLPTRRAA